MADQTWYYKESGQSKGPVSEADLSALFSGGRLPPETSISKDCTDWTEARTVDLFADVLSRAAGAEVRPPVEPLGKIPKETDDAQDRPEARPWVRFWARCIDGLLLTVIVMPFFLSMVGGFGFVQLLLWVGFCLAFEAAMTAFLCATPGKMLLGISVRTTEGGRLTFGQSMLRAGRVLLLGMGLGIPVVNLVTMFLSYQRLLKEGWTLWDTFGPFRVAHKPLGVGRSSMGALVTVGLLAFMFIIKPTAGAAFGTGPSAASANDPYAPKSTTRPASQPVAPGSVSIRPVTEQTPRKTKAAVTPTNKPAPQAKPLVQPSTKPTIKPTGKRAATGTGATKRPSGDLDQRSR